MLFLDESTSGVDPLTRREFRSYINALVARVVTIVVTAHFMDEAETLSGHDRRERTDNDVRAPAPLP